MAVLLLVLLVPLVVGVIVLRALASAHGTGPLIWRYVSGHHLDGRHRTDAGWVTRGTKVLHQTGRASKWAHLPRLHRAAWRLSVPLTVVGVLWGLLAAPLVALPVFGVLAAAGAFLGGRRGIRWFRYRRHNRLVVAPLARALAMPLQTTAHDVERQLHVPLDHGHKDAEVRVAVPDHWQGTDPQREAVARLYQQRLGGEWNTRVIRGKSVLLAASHPPAPPRRVSFAEVADLIRRDGSPDRFLLGIGAGDTPVWLDFSADIAHMGVSVGTGGGKSSYLRFLMAQASFWGIADFPVIDSKLVSLDGMEAIPGMRVYRDVAEQWEAIGAEVAEMQDRYQRLLADRNAQFDTTMMFLEEQNDAAIEWRSHWNGQKSSKDPATPPVYNDLTRYMIKGRQVRKRVIGVYQMLSHSSCGGMDASVMRSSYGAKALARYSHQQWDSLTGIRPRVSSSVIPGRWVMVLGHEVRQVQVPYAEADELVAFALGSPHAAAPGGPPVRVRASSPVRALDPPGVGVRPVVRLVQPDEGQGDAGSPPEAPGPEDGRGEVVVGRRAAANAVGIHPDTFKRARQRHPIPGEFEAAGGQPAWPRDALMRWNETRRAGGPPAATQHDEAAS